MNIKNKLILLACIFSGFIFAGENSDLAQKEKFLSEQVWIKLQQLINDQDLPAKYKGDFETWYSFISNQVDWNAIKGTSDQDKLLISLCMKFVAYADQKHTAQQKKERINNILFRWVGYQDPLCQINEDNFNVIFPEFYEQLQDYEKAEEQEKINQKFKELPADTQAILGNVQKCYPQYANDETFKVWLKRGILNFYRFKDVLIWDVRFSLSQGENPAQYDFYIVVNKLGEKKQKMCFADVIRQINCTQGFEKAFGYKSILGEEYIMFSCYNREMQLIRTIYRELLLSFSELGDTNNSMFLAADLAKQLQNISEPLTRENVNKFTYNSVLENLSRYINKKDDLSVSIGSFSVKKSLLDFSNKVIEQNIIEQQKQKERNALILETVTGISFAGLYGAKAAGGFSHPLAQAICNMAGSATAPVVTSKLGSCLIQSLSYVSDSTYKYIAPEAIKSVAASCTDNQNTVAFFAGASLLYGAGYLFKRIKSGKYQNNLFAKSFITGADCSRKILLGTMLTAGLLPRESNARNVVLGAGIASAGLALPITAVYSFSCNK